MITEFLASVLGWKFEQCSIQIDAHAMCFYASFLWVQLFEINVKNKPIFLESKMDLIWFTTI